jgi:hypothetical protein
MNNFSCGYFHVFIFEGMHHRVTAEQKREFFQQGYLILRNVVPRDKVDTALRLVNQHLSFGTLAFAPRFIRQVFPGKKWRRLRRALSVRQYKGHPRSLACITALL